MVKFNLKGTEIYVTDVRDAYNKIRLQYESKADLGKSEFINIYKKYNKNLDDVVDNAYQQGVNIILEVVDISVNTLVESKFYNINSELFIKKYCQKSIEIWNDAYYKIKDKYMDIILDEKQKDEYRKYRKESRTKWRGGGFGIQGAIKGHVKATSMNMVTGVAHSAVNAVGKVGSSMVAGMEKSKVFNDSSTLKTLENGIYTAIWNIHYAYIKFLTDNTNLRFETIKQNDSEEANIILSNIKNRNIGIEEKIGIIKKLINLNPYSESLYVYMIDNLGDENQEVSKIASYFGYNMNSYKEKIIKRSISNLKTDTEEETIKAKNMLLQEVKYLGIEQNIAEIEKLDKKLEKFDEEARTVENIIFNTREEANIAKSKKLEIKEIINNMDKEDKNSLLRAKNEIIKIGVELDSTKQSINQIDDKLDEIDKNERTVSNILFNTIEEASLAKEDKDKFDNIIENIDLENESSIKQVKDRLESEEFKSRIGEIKIKELEEKLKNIDEQKRTVDNTLFETVEEANLAKEDKEILDKIMKTVNKYDAVSLKRAKEKIKENSFKTKLADKYLSEIEECIVKIYESNLDEANQYETNKQEFQKNLLRSIIYFIIGIPLFGSVGTVLKIVIAILLLNSALNTYDNFNKLTSSKKAIGKINKIKDII